MDESDSAARGYANRVQGRKFISRNHHSRQTPLGPSMNGTINVDEDVDKFKVEVEPPEDENVDDDEIMINW